MRLAHWQRIARRCIRHFGQGTTVTIEYPTYTDDPAGIGSIEGGSSTKTVLAFVREDVETPPGVAPPLGPGSPPALQLTAFLPAHDTSGAALPRLTTDCRVTLPDGRVLAVLAPRPLPAAGAPIYYQPRLGTGA